MDEAKARKQEVAGDRADADTAGGFFLGTNALPVVRRFLWGVLGVGGLGVLLLGGVWWTLSGIGGILRAIEVVLRTR